MKRRRALALGVSALTAGLGCGKSQSPSGARVVEAKRQDLVIDVEVTGTLKSTEAELLGPPPVSEVWEFKIARMEPEGAKVPAGKPVLMFDPSELQKRLRDYESEAASLSEQVGKAEAESRLARLNDGLSLEESAANARKKDLKADKPKDLTAELTLRAARLDQELAAREVEFQTRKTMNNRRRERADLTSLRDQLGRAQTRVKLIREAIEAMAVKARRAGTIVYRQDWRGEKKKVGDQLWRGETALEIASLEKMGATGQVDEVDASRVRKGQRVGLRLEANPDDEHAGFVADIETLVRNESPESRIKVAQLEIRLEKTDTAIMRPGMRFRGRIEVDRVAKVLQVPLAAVRSTPHGPQVMLVDGGEPRAVAVKLGRRSREFVEVLSGVREGQRVALSGGPGKPKASGGGRVGGA